MRCFNYSECEKNDALFAYLDECLNEGYLNYKVNEAHDEIIIENFTIDDDDEIYGKLINKFDLIEDIDYEDFSDDTYDDFYDEDLDDY